MMLYEFTEPKQLKAGSVGEAKKPFYHDCADCLQHEAVIHGCLASGLVTTTCDPNFGVIKAGPFFRLAVFCKECFDKRVEAGKEYQK